MQLQALFAGNALNIFYLLVVTPAVLAVLLGVLPRITYNIRCALFVLGALVNLAGAIIVYRLDEVSLYLPWAGYDFGINFVLRIYDLSQAMILFAAVMGVLVAIYSASFVRRKTYNNAFFFFYLLIIALVNGALISDNLAMMLFFWEGLLVAIFCMILLGNRSQTATAVKALLLNGITDLVLMLGIIATCLAAGGTVMSDISHIPIQGLGLLGFVCMTIGAFGKAGAVPFHSWIPDAAKDAPLPFMAIMPAAFEKLLGIYLLYRITFDFYDFQPGSSMSVLIMSVGAATIFLAAAMAMIQKDMKRMLSFHAVSQVGYMILSIGTGLTVGFVAGLFHMVNHVIYKCCLFLGAGAVEHRTGTTDLTKVGGLGRYMPLSALCFLAAALSIAGVPPFNGFFSKELIFEAARQTGTVWYIIAVVGAFMTAASFLKISHGAFFGPLRLPAGVKKEDIKEAPGAMVLPMVVLAALCLIFGVANRIPLRIIEPLLGEATAGISFVGWPQSTTMVLVSVAVLLLAVGNHLVGFSATGEGIKSLDHIHYAPVLRGLYDCAEKHYFDPYDIFMVVVRIYAWLCFVLDRSVDWLFSTCFVNIINFCTTSLHSFNTGSPSRYITWTFAGLGFLVFLFILLV